LSPVNAKGIATGANLKASVLARLQVPLSFVHSNVHLHAFAQAGSAVFMNEDEAVMREVIRESWVQMQQAWKASCGVGIVIPFTGWHVELNYVMPLKGAASEFNKFNLTFQLR